MLEFLRNKLNEQKTEGTDNIPSPVEAIDKKDSTESTVPPIAPNPDDFGLQNKEASGEEGPADPQRLSYDDAMDLVEEGAMITRPGFGDRYLEMEKRSGELVCVYPEGSAAFPGGKREKYVPSRSDKEADDWFVIMDSQDD